MSPFDILTAYHRRHYEPGTLEWFTDWFAQSGCRAMLELPLLRGSSAPYRTVEALPASFRAIASVRLDNAGQGAWPITFHAKLGHGATSLEELFRQLATCTGHTHPLGDFRLFPETFVDVLAGTRFVAFHGAGSCLLLSALIQALAARLLGEHVELHYSRSSHGEFTHVFGVSADGMLVDLDQKTWAGMTNIDDVPSFGYIFQQFGVAGHLIYLDFDEAERRSLFASMTRAYFDDYEGSRRQYMYRSRHQIEDLASLFRDARANNCEALSLLACDYPWKARMREIAAARSISAPYFLVDDAPVTLAIPPGATFSIGNEAGALPEEIARLAAIYFGRVPGVLRVGLVADAEDEVTLPDVPWALVLPAADPAVRINGVLKRGRPSRDGRSAILGLGDLEDVLDLKGTGPILKLATSGSVTLDIVMPVNAFALGGDVVALAADPGAGRTIEVRGAA